MVVDAKQETCFCSKLISSESSIQLNSQEQVLFWVGDPRKDGTIPAWVFYIIEPSMVDGLKGAITKAIFETNHQRLMAETGVKVASNSNKSQNASSNASSDNGDEQWLESTIIADRMVMDQDMENGSELVDEFEFDDPGVDQVDLQNIDDIFDKYEEVDLEESRIDEDLEPEFRDGKNKECLQAMSYDRAFVVSGPVVKVYKNSEDEDLADQQRLKYLMHCPVMKDERGDILEPTNLMLHSNESSLMFIDKNDRNRLINFDLEKGQISEDIHFKK